MEIVGENGAVLNPHKFFAGNGKDCSRPTKAVREVAVFLVKELGVNPFSMITALGRAIYEIGKVDIDEWRKARNKAVKNGVVLNGSV